MVLRTFLMSDKSINTSKRGLNPIHQLPGLLLGVVGCLFLAHALGAVAAQTPVDEEAPWPRVRSTNGNTVTLHLPQVERWTSNWFSARAAVEVKPAKAKERIGSAWCGSRRMAAWIAPTGSSRSTVWKSPRRGSRRRRTMAATPSPSCAKSSRPGRAPCRSITCHRARLRAGGGAPGAGADSSTRRRRSSGPRTAPCSCSIDGEPVLRPIPASALERVINTPALLVHDKANAKFYLAGDGQWFAAGSIKGPWSLAQNPPAEWPRSAPAPTNGPARARRRTAAPDHRQHRARRNC